MAVRMADTAEPMGDFPIAKAKHIEFEDGEKLQEKLDNGTLGSGGGAPYDDTIVRGLIDTNKTDIADLNTKIGTTAMGTTATDVTGAVAEVNGNLLDTVSFSADYKNIVLNRKNGTNPYTIPIAAIINHAKLIELADIDVTDIGNGKTLVYDAATQKHKYANITGTDELVKMDNTSDAHYLADLIDKQTVVNDNGVLKVKKLDGQEVTIAEINYLKGLTMNVMDLVNMFSNGGVKIINTPVNTYAELLTFDKTSLIDDISYIIYVLADETHDNAKTTYLIDKATSTPTYFGFAGEHRDFTTNPIDLASEVTGKLGTANIDVDSLWALLTIDDTYKTLTTTNNAFGTHGAKAMYDELVAGIGAKANQTDFDTHKDDTTIHISSDERTKWNDTAAKVDGAELVKKADIKTTTLDESATDDEIYSGKAIFDAIKNNCVGKETVLYEGAITAKGTYTLADNVNNYDFIIINYKRPSGTNCQSLVMTKIEVSKSIDIYNKFICVYGLSSDNFYTAGYFNGNKIIIDEYVSENITSITGYKFGQITVENTITNPAVGKSYSLDEQLTGGTWIDDKPIYRKVIPSTFELSAGSAKTITLSEFGVNNVDTPISLDILAVDGAVKGIRDTKLMGDFTPSQVYIVNTTSKWSLASGEQKIVIEYTKTTD